MSKILVLGGSFLQSTFINKAAELGFELLVLDGSLDCYVSKWPNIEFVHADFSDYEKVKELALDYNPLLVYAPCNEIGNLIAAKLSKKIGYSYNSVEVVQSSLDKSLQRKIASKCDLLYSPKCLKYNRDLSKIQKTLSYPMIVKPSRSSASRGVSSAKNLEELQLAIESASRFLEKGGCVMIEEYLEGDQISVETISANGVHSIVGITKEELSGAPYFIERCHHMSSEIHQTYFDLIEQKVYQLLNQMGVEFGPCHIELMVSGDKVSLIEIATRAGGLRDGLMNCAGYADYNEMILEAFLNKTVSKSKNILPQRNGLVNILMNPEDLNSVLRASKDGVLSTVYFNQKPPAFKPENLMDAYGYAYMSSHQSLKNYALKNQL